VTLPAGRRTSLGALALVALAALVLGACGGEEDKQAAEAGPAEQAFLEAMVPHHETAVEMALVAGQRAEHPQVSELAAAIVGAQQKEIRRMRRMHERLFGDMLRPNIDSHQQLGLSAEEAGMMHGMEAVEELEKTKPFDRAFIDEMVPHHQGAIRMARVLGGKTEDPEMKRLAEAIIRTQSSEIRRMNAWRTKWFRAPSPAGGVPEPGKEVALPGEHH
jgi:uncharacterized protein (DUF305 family)